MHIRSLHHKLDRWCGYRFLLALLPDASLRGVGTAYQVPEELVRMTRCGANHLTVDEPVNSDGRDIFWQGQRQDFERVGNAGVHGQLQSGRRAHQAQRRWRCARWHRRCWLVQRTDMLGLCARHKPLARGRAMGAGTLPGQTADSRWDEAWAAG